MQRITITLDDDLMRDLDAMIVEHGYQNRSEAIRDLTRAGMQQAAQEQGKVGECVAFGIDHNGDIYLDGRISLAAVTPTEIDRLLGAVLMYADESFNTILELGFATSIRKEWDWRVKRGESTANLHAFRGWLDPGHLG